MIVDAGIIICIAASFLIIRKQTSPLSRKDHFWRTVIAIGVVIALTLPIDEIENSIKSDGAEQYFLGDLLLPISGMIISIWNARRLLALGQSRYWAMLTNIPGFGYILSIALFFWKKDKQDLIFNSSKDQPESAATDT